MKYIVPAGELNLEFLEGLAKKDEHPGSNIVLRWHGLFQRTAKYDGKNLASLENALDKLYYYRMERAVGGTLSVGGGLLLKYVRREIDIRNLITLFRMNKAGVDAAIDSGEPDTRRKARRAELSRLAGQPSASSCRGLEGYPFWSSISDIATPRP